MKGHRFARYMVFGALLALLGIFAACAGHSGTITLDKGFSPAPISHPASSGPWQIQVVDSAGDVGLSPSLAYGPDGNPAISYHSWTPDYGLKFAHRTGASWSTEFVEVLPVNSDAFDGTSLAFDPSGSPGISYLHHINGTGFNGKLWYAKRNGASWSLEEIPDYSAVGQYSSLKYDSTGKAMISYHLSSTAIKFAKWTGTSWQIELPDPAGESEFYSSLAVDSADRPHFSYGTGYGQLRYASWNGATWDIQIVDSGIGSGWPYNHIQNSLALDSAGRPHIAYRDDLNQVLKYATWTGSTWVTETVDGVGNVGLGCSLALDSAGNPFISYADLTSGTVKMAVNHGSGWEIDVVDTGLGGAGWDTAYTSLALNSTGNPSIAYYDFTDSVLKFSASANSPPDTSHACATPDRLWPPNHKMVNITIGCVTDPDGDPVTITVTGITQDEPVNGLGDGDTSPDGIIRPLQVRAERSGTGDGRVYHIQFTASDGIVPPEAGEVTVCVPHDENGTCVDSGPPWYDSAQR